MAVQRGAELERARPAGLDKIVGGYRNLQQLNERLQEASESGHLITPATSVGYIPDGFSVAITAVHVDARPVKESGEVYDVGGGKLALVKSALRRIGNAAGVNWLESKRTDDGSRANYVSWQAKATWKDFAGEPQGLIGNVTMDLRESSEQIIGIRERARDGSDAEKQIRDLRLFMHRHAESKAKNCALRDLGMKANFSREELKKPFFVAKLMFTGESDDPVLRRRWAELRVLRELQGSAALFGAASAVAGQLPAAPAAIMSAVPANFRVVDGGEDEEEAPPPSAPQERRAASQRQQARPAARQAAPPPQRSGPPSAFQVPFGKSKGKYLHEVDERDLAFLRQYAEDKLNDPSKARYASENQAMLDAVLAEMAAREGGPGPDEDEDGDEVDPETGEVRERGGRQPGED